MKTAIAAMARPLLANVNPTLDWVRLLDAVQQRLDANPLAMRQRRETVEHPFGTMKARMGATHFLTKTLPKVAAEMALSVLAYNLTEAHIMEAFRLSPRDHKASSWMNTAGVAQSYLGADEAAVHWFKRSIETNRNIAPFVHFFLAAALAHLAQIEGARAYLRRGLVLAPSFSIEQFHASSPTDHPICLAQRARIAEGLRKAGLSQK